MQADTLTEELIVRRQYALEMIDSLQSHFIKLYMSGTIQCRKGYNNSRECDSFHLGEMTKFFSRKGTLQLLGRFTEREPEAYSGDIRDLIARLKQCPDYQIDQNHRHCGVRTRIKPLLAKLCVNEQIGICLQCWRRNKAEDSWLYNPLGGKWTLKNGIPLNDLDCQRQSSLKHFYTADVRDWTPDL